MKKLFSLVTLSFLASSTMVEAKFNADNVLAEKIPGRVITKAAKRYMVLELKEGDQNHKNPIGRRNIALLKAEKNTLAELFYSKLKNKPKAVQDAQKAIYLKAVAARKKAIGKFNPNTANVETFGNRWLYLLQKDMYEGTNDYVDQAHKVMDLGVLVKALYNDIDIKPNQMPALAKMKAIYLEARKAKALRKAPAKPAPKAVVQPAKVVAAKPAPKAEVQPAKPVAAKPAPKAVVQPAKPAAAKPAPKVVVQPAKPAAAKPAPKVVVQPAKPAAPKPAPNAVVQPAKPAAPKPAPKVVVQPEKPAVAKQAPKVVDKQLAAKQLAAKQQAAARQQALAKQQAAARKGPVKPAPKAAVQKNEPIINMLNNMNAILKQANDDVAKMIQDDKKMNAVLKQMNVDLKQANEKLAKINQKKNDAAMNVHNRVPVKR